MTSNEIICKLYYSSNYFENMQLPRISIFQPNERTVSKEEMYVSDTSSLNWVLKMKFGVMMLSNGFYSSIFCLANLTFIVSLMEIKILISYESYAIMCNKANIWVEFKYLGSLFIYYNEEEWMCIMWKYSSRIYTFKFM